MERKFDQDQLTLLLETRQLRELHDALVQSRSVDVARFLGDLEPEQAILVLDVYKRQVRDRAADSRDACRPAFFHRGRKCEFRRYRSRENAAIPYCQSCRYRR